jgi:hypothetical protein
VVGSQRVQVISSQDREDISSLNRSNREVISSLNRSNREVISRLNSRATSRLISQASSLIPKARPPEHRVIWAALSVLVRSHRSSNPLWVASRHWTLMTIFRSDHPHQLIVIFKPHDWGFLLFCWLKIFRLKVETKSAVNH